MPVNLQSADQRTFHVEEEVARMSTFIAAKMEEGAQAMIPIGVRGDILELVIQWATHHQGDDPPVDDEAQRTAEIPAWDQTFLQGQQPGALFDLILTAKQLGIKGLEVSSCKFVANMLKARTPDQIREDFRIKNDFNRAEEEQIRKENQWCEER